MQLEQIIGRALMRIKKACKRPGSKSKYSIFLPTILLCLTISWGLTSCKQSKGLKLPGKLLLCTEEKTFILDGSGNIETELDEKMLGASWSPDRQRILFTDLKFNLYVYDLQTKEKAQLFKEQSVFYPEEFDWSPDGQEIAFLKGRELYIVSSVASTDPRLIWRCENPCMTLQWSSDGQYIFVGEGFRLSLGSPRLMKVNIGTSQAIEMFELDIPAFEMRWDPRGERVAITTRDQGIFIFDKDGKLQRSVATGQVSSPVWSPDGQWLALTNCEGHFTRLKCKVEVYNLVSGAKKEISFQKGLWLFETPPRGWINGWRE